MEMLMGKLSLHSMIHGFSSHLPDDQRVHHMQLTNVGLKSMRFVPTNGKCESSTSAFYTPKAPRSTKAPRQSVSCISHCITWIILDRKKLKFGERWNSNGPAKSLWQYGPTAFNGSVPVKQHKLRVTMTCCLINGLALVAEEQTHHSFQYQHATTLPKQY